MSVSVVIPCLNEKKYINDCVTSLVKSEFHQADMEILIVDGGSADGTLSVIEYLQKKHHNIKVISNPNKKTPFALNIGIKSAKGNYILIAGAHAVYPKNYIAKLYNSIQKNGVDVVGGGIETMVKKSNSKTEAIKFVLSHRFGVGNSIFRVGATGFIKVDTVPFGLYKKQVFDKVGVYNEKLIRNHDIELSKRIKQNGFSIWLDPSLIVTYYARETFIKLAKNNFGNGYWNLRTLFITHRLQSLSLRHYIPLLFVVSLVLPMVLGVLCCPVFVVISAISLTCYMGAIFLVALLNLKKQYPLYLFWAFVTLHLSYGFGSLMGALSGLMFWKK